MPVNAAASAGLALILFSMPAASADTLQLVTGNGNVFSLDYDEMLAALGRSAEARAGLNDPAGGPASADADESAGEPQEDQDAADDGLRDEIDELGRQLEGVISASGQTAAGALGSSGRLVNVQPRDGHVIYGSSSESGEVVGAAPYLRYDAGAHDYVAYLQDGYEKATYDIPRLGGSYTISGGSLDWAHPDRWNVKQQRVLDGDVSLSGSVASGSGVLLLEVEGDFTAPFSYDWPVGDFPPGGRIVAAATPNDLMNMQYDSGKFVFGEGRILFGLDPAGPRDLLETLQSGLYQFRVLRTDLSLSDGIACPHAGEEEAPLLGGTCYHVDVADRLENDDDTAPGEAVVLIEPEGTNRQGQGTGFNRYAAVYDILPVLIGEPAYVYDRDGAVSISDDRTQTHYGKCRLDHAGDYAGCQIGRSDGPPLGATLSGAADGSGRFLMVDRIDFAADSAPAGSPGGVWRSPDQYAPSAHASYRLAEEAPYYVMADTARQGSGTFLYGSGHPGDNFYLVVSVDGLMETGIGSLPGGVLLQVSNAGHDRVWVIRDPGGHIAYAGVSQDGKIMATGAMPADLRGYTLDIYDDAPVMGSGAANALIDAYNGRITASYSPFGSGDHNIMVAMAYLRYPITTDASISDVRMSKGGSCDMDSYQIRHLGGEYGAGDSMHVPVMPGASVLCMKIGGFDIVVRLADIAEPASIASIPPARGAGVEQMTLLETSRESGRHQGVIRTGQQTVSSVAAFAHSNGVMNANVVVGASGGAAVQRHIDFAPRYALDDTQISECGPYRSNDPCRHRAGAQERLLEYARENWSGWVGDSVAVTSGFDIVINVYRNGSPVLSEREGFGRSATLAINNSGVEPFAALQEYATAYEAVRVEKTLSFHADAADFVQIEVVIDHRLDHDGGLPPLTPPGNIFACEYAPHAVIHTVVEEGMSFQPPRDYRSGCMDTDRDFMGALDYVRQIETVLADPDAKNVITMGGESMWSEIRGGHVIFY